MANVQERHLRPLEDNGNGQSQNHVKRRKEAPSKTGRTALGTITNEIRRQPPRAAKGSNDTEVQDENARVRQKQISAGGGAPSFTIFVDDSQAESTTAVTKASKPKDGLSAAVTALQIGTRDLQPLAETDDDDEMSDLPGSPDSPMVLDHALETEQENLSDSAARAGETIIKECPEYAEEILSYMRDAEKEHRARPGYISKQPDLTPNMRSILVDWMVEVSEEYSLQRETLFLAVNYIDRFLSQMSVMRGKLQLVGAASMFLASKYEDIYPPDVAEFVYITDDTYTKKQILRMEHLILKVLLFHVAVPTINWFSENFLSRTKAGDKLISLTMFLCELSLISVDPYVQFLPSTVAASALLLARMTLGMEPWPQSVAVATRYTVRELFQCSMHLFNTFRDASSHSQQAVQEKYKAAKFHEVATLRPRQELKAWLHQMSHLDYTLGGDTQGQRS